MSFLDSLEQNLNKTARTLNGAVSNNSTLDPVLDFFSKAGAMRQDVNGAVRLFSKAYSSDPQLAIRALFYLRDVRGGQGEREIFKAILKELNKNYPSTARVIIKHIPEYGRWDEVLEIIDGFDSENVSFISAQFEEDMRNLEAGNSVSLMAKWLPSENTSSKATRDKARKLQALLGLKPSQYRKKLSALRKHIKLLEHEMTNRNWSEIDFSKIPAQAHRKHVKAFMRHDEERYRAYLAAVEKGDAKINTSTLYTYEVYNMVQKGEKASANAMWKNLPDFTNGQNALVMADVSGSMYGTPMAMSVSLALYFAERNEGPFKNYFMTFSTEPELVKIIGNTLSEKMHNIERANWDMSTNIEAAFRSILDAAKSSNASQDEMPKTLYIISDMQFNGCVRDGSSTNLENARSMFKAAGYELPHVIFWNVNAYSDSPATIYDKNVTLISGASQSTFKYVFAGKTPLESMLEVLESDRYAQIVL